MSFIDFQKFGLKKPVYKGNPNMIGGFCEMIKKYKKISSRPNNTVQY